MCVSYKCVNVIKLRFDFMLLLFVRYGWHSISIAIRFVDNKITKILQCDVVVVLNGIWHDFISYSFAFFRNVTAFV